MSATGGSITTSGSYNIHSFTTVGTSAFVPVSSGTVEVLIVGGGGGGGASIGGGGGGGGVIYIPSVNVTSGTSYSIVVGDGGLSDTNGQNSRAFGAIAAGGGGGGYFGSGNAGGSGGGSAYNDPTNVGGLSSGNSLGSNSGTIYGNRGGNMTTRRIGEEGRGAGGGGAGGQALDTNPNITGNTGQTGAGSGGVGVINAILGTSYYWAGGGGGGGHTRQTGGWGGLGGGGGGSTDGNNGGTGGGSALNSGANGALYVTGGAGGANTGGGGGAGSDFRNGGKGGSGIVVIRYMPFFAPNAPTNVTASAGNAQATVNWTASTNNGGSAITSYTVTSSPHGRTATTTNVSTTTITATVTGLTNGTAYTFTVVATNVAGNSSSSAASSSVTPRTVPNAPTNVTATAGNTQVTVNWNLSTNNGGSAITSYTVTSSPEGRTATTDNGSTRTATVTGLTNGIAYTFTVVATNALGNSPTASVGPVTPRTIPNAPTNVTATEGNTQAIVNWTASTNNGGSAITSYTVTSSPGNFQATTTNVSTTTVTATVTGLTNGIAYTFTVVASNDAGPSSASSPASTPVTPKTLPNAPTNVTASAGNAQAIINWTAPTNNGGSAITSYTVTSSPSGLTTTTANGSSTTATVTGLTNGIAYTFTVVATNAVGNSTASAVSNSVTPNNKVAISNDGKVVAFASSSLYSDISKGRVYVYELSYNETSSSWNQLGLSSEIIVGASNEDQFGWDLALSSNGRIVAGSSIASDASGINSGQVRLFELSNNRWVKKGSDINGPRAGSESGYSISLAGSGNSIAIGAWKDNLNGTNAGAVRVYDFSASINDWRQKGQTIAGVVGSFEGYSTALSLDGQTLASSSIASIASGGTITSTDSYTIHTFTTLGTSTFTATSTRTVEVLIVGGGGGGGSNLGGGGGGGGVVYMPAVNITSGTNYSIVVGDGGNSNTNGQNSTAFGATAAGGGTSGSWPSGSGTAGGSGGGAPANDGAINQGGGTSGNILGTNNGFIYGNRGGHMTTGRTGGPTRAAGGGGAGGQGLDTNSNTTGDTGRTGMGSGGVGVVNAILGPSYYWGGGGGGASWDNQIGGYGGLGGGGGGGGAGSPTIGVGLGGGSALNSGTNGSLGTNTNGGAGGANTGGGGGGGNHSSGQGGKGGSGIVVIRYINSAIINTYTISGSSWIPKGIIQGSATNNSYFGRSMKLSANGNTIVIGALGYGYINEYRITPSYEFISTTMSWQAHRDNALTVFGRDLAVILNASQNTQANALRNNTLAFIGGRRVANPISATGKTAADWEWVTGDAWSYENFSNGEPNGTHEKAVHFWVVDGKWNDIHLESNYPAIYMYYKVRAQQVNVERAYVYGHQGGTTWTQLGQTIREISGGIEFGSSVNISNDGTIISVGTNDISSNRGYVNVYKYVNNYWTLIGNTLNGKVVTSKAGVHALSGDGTTLIQSNANYYSIYGINKTLALNSPATTISGNLIVIGSSAFNSLDISRNHSYSSNGYSYKVFESPLTSAIMKEYYSDVTSTKHLKVQILGNGNITNRNNSYRALSDSRLKENIVTSGPKLEDLLKVRVVNYNLKGQDTTKYIGVLAQELEELFPNLVTEIEPSPKDVEEGRLIKYKAVNYSSFDALLIKSLQEQNAMLKNITQRIEALEEALG